jgi:hypothetical protein
MIAAMYKLAGSRMVEILSVPTSARDRPSTRLFLASLVRSALASRCHEHFRKGVADAARSRAVPLSSKGFHA